MTTINNELTEKQTKFIELIFLPEYIGNEQQAKLDAGYSQNTELAHIYESVKKVIIEKSDTLLAKLLPKSFVGLEDVLDNSAQKGAKAKLEAIWGILDRVGISKKDRLEIDVKASNGVFILPQKQTE